MRKFFQINLALLILSLLILAGLFFRSSMAASFDCARAASAVERMICANEELSSLDEIMAEKYNALRSHELRTEILVEQRQWLRNERNKCEDVDCLRNSYRGRIAQLTSGVAHKEIQPKLQEGSMDESVFFSIPLEKNLSVSLQQEYFLMPQDLCENDDKARAEAMLTGRSCTAYVIPVALDTNAGPRLMGLGFVILSLSGNVESLELRATAEGTYSQSSDQIIEYFWTSVERFKSERGGATRRTHRNNNILSEFYFGTNVTSILTLNVENPADPYVNNVFISNKAFKRRLP